MKKTLFVTALALIDQEGHLLLAQRPEGKHLAGLWEFPGGKVNEGETPEQSIIREIKEELNIEIKEKDIKPLSFASHSYEAFHLFMPLYICRKWHGTPTAMEDQAIAWVAADAFKDYPTPPADGPLLQRVETELLLERVTKELESIVGPYSEPRTKSSSGIGFFASLKAAAIRATRAIKRTS